jgi:low temperature requirement protein LtrA
MSSWSALVRPPRIQADSDRSASRLELFFDLAFVLAVQHSADRLGGDLTWHGAGVSAGLIAVIWWAWASSTLYANRFDTDDVVYRLSKLSGMGAVVVLAAAAPSVESGGAWRFALGYAVLRFILVLQYARAWRHVPDARAAIRPYVYAHGISGVLWLASIAVPGPGKYWLWGVGLVLEFTAPLTAGQAGDQAPVHLEHLPERFALFVILVLGESVAAVVTGLQTSEWDGRSVAVAVPSFVIAVALWWMYFDLSGAAAKWRLQEEGRRSRIGVHDRFVFAHLPLSAGLVAVGVGLEHAISEAADGAISPGTRWTLVGGVALYLVSAISLQALSERSLNRLLWPGLGVPVVLLAGVLTSGITIIIVLAAILVTGVIAGLARRETGDLPTAEV